MEAGSVVKAGSYLREGVYIGRNASVGANCEIKQSIIFHESRIAHLNYVGAGLGATATKVNSLAIQRLWSWKYLLMAQTG